ncbi:MULTISPECIES: hypothetical protein [unclassified Campylobacter]
MVASVVLADGGFVGVSGGYNFVNKANLTTTISKTPKAKSQIWYQGWI